MKTRLTRFLAVALLLFIVAPAFAQLPQKLAQFKNISGIKELPVWDKMENPFKEKYVMFFGYIRDYKGLDLLIDAWAMLHKRGLTQGRKLLVVGEVYGADTKYTEQIARLGLEDEVVMHTRFVPDGEVADYFSVAQMVALPYKSATQSGVTQVAYAFGVPMIVTRVGGLAEIVPDGVVGLLADVSAESVAEAIEKAWQEGNLDRFREGIEREKHRFSWDATADVIEQLYEQIK
jgi:glycosyltransferase involved in cell wall biosynthesis